MIKSRTIILFIIIFIVPYCYADASHKLGISYSPVNTFYYPKIESISDYEDSKSKYGLVLAGVNLYYDSSRIGKYLYQIETGINIPIMAAGEPLSLKLENFTGYEYFTFQIHLKTSMYFEVLKYLYFGIGIGFNYDGLTKRIYKNGDINPIDESSYNIFLPISIKINPVSISYHPSIYNLNKEEFEYKHVISFNIELDLLSF